MASTLIAARQAEGAEAASLREDLLSLNIAPQRRRDDPDGDNASEALATVGSGSMVDMAQSPGGGGGGGGAMGSPMDFSSDGSEGDGEGSGHGARSLGGSTLNTLNSQEVELMGTEEGENDGCCNLSLEAAASPTLGPSSASAGGSTQPAHATATAAASMGSSSTSSGPPSSSAVVSTQAVSAPSSTTSSAYASASASARGAMPPPLIIPSAAAAAAASHGHTHSGSVSSFLSAPIGISGSAGATGAGSGGAAEEINSLVVVGSVATTISSYDSVGSLSTIESSASAEVTQRASRQPFAARSSLLKPVAEPDGGGGGGGGGGK